MNKNYLSISCLFNLKLLFSFFMIVTAPYEKSYDFKEIIMYTLQYGIDHTKILVNMLKIYTII